MSHNRLILTLASVGTAALLIAIVLLTGILTKPAPGPVYPALTVTNASTNTTANWSIPGNNSGPPLGVYSLNTTFVENSSGDKSTLHFLESLYENFVGNASGGLVVYQAFVLLTGNISAGLRPSSVSLVFDNLVIGTVSALSVQLQSWGPGLPRNPPAINLTSWNPYAPPVGYSGWGQATNSTGLANVSGAGLGRYYFSYPMFVQAEFYLTSSAARFGLDFRASLGGLGQPIFCQLHSLATVSSV